jgi:hypothetical protein
MAGKVGQPTKYHEGVPQIVIDNMKQGLSIDACCGILGVTRKTFYSWIETHSELAEAVEHGKIMCQVFWEKLGIMGASGKIPGFNAASYIFNMKNRFKWTDRQETTHEAGASIKVVLEDYSK